MLAPCRAVWQGSQRSRPYPIGRFSHPARRCRSSVVEHPLGKGEVVSSILTGSTRKIQVSRVIGGSSAAAFEPMAPT